MVTCCVCCNISLAELLQLAHSHDLNTIKSLHTVACFGQGCGLCLPYVALALHTGRISFEPAETLELETLELETLELETLEFEVLIVANEDYDEVTLTTPRDGE